MTEKIVLISAGLISCVSISAKNFDKKPNVLFIYADDLGRGMLSYFGQKYIKTPNIDRLYKQGTAFDYAYGCTYSAPARGSLLTGYHDCRNDKWNIPKGDVCYDITSESQLEEKEHKVDSFRLELPKGDLYLPQVFRNAGYVTGQFGKLDWGFMATRKQLKEHGWDEYCGYLDHGAAHGFYPRFLVENDTVVWFKENTAPKFGEGNFVDSPETNRQRWNMDGKVTYVQDIFMDRMINFIRKHKNEPFFIWHSTTLPHGPVAVKQIDPEINKIKELSSIEKEYLTMVKILDDSVGELLEELRNQGILDNTMIVFSADNGHETYYGCGNSCTPHYVKDAKGSPLNSWTNPYTSEKVGDRFNGNDGMHGKKRDNLEGGVRVPLVFSFPGYIRENVMLKQVVSNYDLLPTMADMLDVKLNTLKDGVSLIPLLFDGKDKFEEERYIFCNSQDGPSVIDNEHWKLRYNKKTGEFRLYNLANDYTEENILNDKYPQKFETLKARLNPFLGALPHFPVKWYKLNKKKK